MATKFVRLLSDHHWPWQSTKEKNFLSKGEIIEVKEDDNKWWKIKNDGRIIHKENCEIIETFEIEAIRSSLLGIYKKGDRFLACHYGTFFQRKTYIIDNDYVLLSGKYKGTTVISGNFKKIKKENKCLEKDTFVLLNDGSFIAVKNIYNHSEIKTKSFSEENRRKTVSLTKLQALEETAKGWKDLRDNPEKNKSHISLFKNYNHNCPCCEYMHGPKGIKISNCRSTCPMYKAWGNKMCEEGGSPYYKWRCLQFNFKLLYDISFFAGLIAEWAEYLADLERERLKAEKNLNKPNTKVLYTTLTNVYDEIIDNNNDIMYKRENK